MESIIKISKYKIVKTEKQFTINYSKKSFFVEIIIFTIIIISWIFMFNKYIQSITQTISINRVVYFIIFAIPILFIFFYLLQRIYKVSRRPYYKFDKIKNIVYRNKKEIAKFNDIINTFVNKIDTGMEPPIYRMVLLLRSNNEIIIDKNSSQNDIQQLCDEFETFMNS